MNKLNVYGDGWRGKQQEATPSSRLVDTPPEKRDAEEGEKGGRVLTFIRVRLVNLTVSEKR